MIDDPRKETTTYRVQRKNQPPPEYEVTIYPMDKAGILLSSNLTGWYRQDQLPQWMRESIALLDGNMLDEAHIKGVGQKNMLPADDMFDPHEPVYWFWAVGIAGKDEEE
jgi:hypothetical protein